MSADINNGGQGKGGSAVGAISSFLGLIAALAVGYYLSDAMFGRKVPDLSEKSVAGITILAPGDFSKNPFTASEMTSLKQVASFAERYTSDSTGKNIGVMIMKTTYKEGAITSIQGAVSGFISGVKRTIGVKDFTQKIKDTQISGMPAKRLSVSYTSFGLQKYGEILIVVDDSHQWHISATYIGESDDLKEAASKIVDSVKIIS